MRRWWRQLRQWLGFGPLDLTPPFFDDGPPPHRMWRDGDPTGRRQAD